MVAWPVAPTRVNSNHTRHCRESGVSAGVNFHFLAASVARRAKYLLGPGFSKVSPTTFPDLSTVTRTAILKCPRIVSLALRGTSGISLWSTEDEASAVGCAARSEGRATPVEGAGLDAVTDFVDGEWAETSGDQAWYGVEFCESAAGGTVC